MKPYPQVVDNTTENHTAFLKQISRLRQEDVQFITNLPQQYLLGRKVNKVPAASADVVSTDKIGDFNVTDTFAYYLIDNAGTPEWRRTAVASW